MIKTPIQWLKKHSCTKMQESTFLSNFNLLFIHLFFENKETFLSDKMNFDCVVQWDNGARDSVVITDLIMNEDQLVSSKYNETRTRKVQIFPDINNVEFLWDKDANTNRFKIRYSKLWRPEKCLRKKTLWKDTNDAAEEEIVRMITGSHQTEKENQIAC